jgi:hypothetical protein
MGTTIPSKPINPPVPEQIQTNAAKPSNTKPILLFGSIIALILGVGTGMYYLGIQQKQNNQISQQPAPFATSVTPIIFEPLETEKQSSTVSATITWKTQKILIQEDSERTGKITINMELKLPSDWTFTTTPITGKPDDMIKNCSTYTIKSPDQKGILTLQPICSGWAAKNSPWPASGVIALQRNCNSNDGPHTCYRVRYLTPSNIYTYVDAMTQANRPLNRNTDQVSDALTIGYAPPNDSADDFFFIPAHLSLEYSGTNTEKSAYFTITDQIASSITLQK